MTSLRSKLSPPGIRSALILLLALGALLPATAMAAPEGEEGPAPAPQLAFEPGSHDFGMQPVNNYGGETNFQLRNIGEYPAPVYNIDVVGGNGAFWTGNSNCFSGPLGPGQTCSVQVHFGPGYAGAFTAQLRASSEFGTTFLAELSGEGGRAVLTPASEPTNFGSAAVGSAGVTKTIEIANSGNYPGGAFIALIAGGAIGSFQLLDESCTGVILAPGSSCNMVVRFKPLSTGVKTARLGLFGDSDGGTQVTLTGVGTDAEPVVSLGAEQSSTNVAAPKSAHKQRARARQQQRKRLQRLRQRHHRVAVFAHRAIR